MFDLSCINVFAAFARAGINGIVNVEVVQNIGADFPST